MKCRESRPIRAGADAGLPALGDGGSGGSGGVMVPPRVMAGLPKPAASSARGAALKLRVQASFS